MSVVDAATIPIPLPRLAISVGLVAVAVGVARRRGLGLDGSFAWGALRAAIQLIALGYVLSALFQARTPWPVLLALVVMLSVAAYTSAGRVRHGPGTRALLPHALLAVAAGSAAALVPVVALIVPVRPWFDPRYVVPLAGMVIASAMNVVALVFERVFTSIHADPTSVEARLALGATPAQALEPLRRDAMRAALVPTINGLLTVGLVALPGMMTGQILAGASPGEAVRYQLVVMYELCTVAAVSGELAARACVRLAFTTGAHLVERSARC